MRRPVMYLAGLLLATGASFALAGPASAAVSHDSHASTVTGNPFGNPYGNPFGDSLNFTSISDSGNPYQGASQTGIFLLSPMGNGGNLLPILSGPFN